MADEHLPGIPTPGEQTSLEIVSQNGTVSPVTEGQNVFRRDNPREQYQRDRIRRHKQWLETLIHEYPMPYSKYRIGVYIRYFNQTKHENYLDYHKQQFIDAFTNSRHHIKMRGLLLSSPATHRLGFCSVPTLHN